MPNDTVKSNEKNVFTTRDGRRSPSQGETMKANEFVTSFGDRIPVLPGHIEFLYETYGLKNSPEKLRAHFDAASTNVSGGYENLDQEKLAKSREQVVAPSLGKYAITCMHAQLLVHILNNHTTIPARFNRLLDIGTGYGIQPRVLKGLGVVNEAVAIDLFDRTSMIESATVRKLHRRFRRFRYIDHWIERIHRKPKAEWSDFEKALVYKVGSPRHMLFNGVGFNLPKDVYKAKFVQDPNLDRFIEGNVYDLDEKFDLITSFSSIEWFQLDDIMRKISNLLTNDGVFYMWVGSWWYPNNVSAVFGHFPYAAQRLNRDDFVRYTKEFLPKSQSDYQTAYEYFDNVHPTISDYMEAGYRYGLLPVFFHNSAIPGIFNPSRGMTPLGYAEYYREGFGDVLRDIQRFRPDVRFEDLFSGLYFIVFKKADPERVISPSFLQDLIAEAQFSYRPKSLILKRIRSAAIKYFITGRHK